MESQTDKDQSSQNSINDQRDEVKDNLSPGPGAYSLEYAMRTVYPSAPQYSLTGRHYYPDQDSNPGPCYFPDFRPCKKTAPQYSFGIRHSMHKAPFIVQYKK